jgi:hypothetical protein
MYVSTLAIIAGLGARVFANTDNDKVYKHVVTFSVDGVHGSDVKKYVALRPESTIATLLKTAYRLISRRGRFCDRIEPKNNWYAKISKISGIILTNLRNLVR